MSPALKFDDAQRAKSRLRVLVADDNPDTVLTLTLLLQHEGHSVITVTAAKNVLDAVARLKPNVCILDLEMPERSGYAVASDLGAKYGSSAPLLIAISGRWTSPSEKILASTVGFDYFLAKPANPQEVLRILGEYDPSRPLR